MADWISELDGPNQAKARVLIAFLDEAGVSDSEGWVRSEMRENIPQTARAMFLRSIWPKQIDRFLESAWIDEAVAAAADDASGAFADGGSALERMRRAGVSPDDIGRVARSVAYRTVFDLLYHLGYGCDQDVEGGPGWRLMEVDQETDELTGRSIDTLYEDLLGMDPTGREGSPE